MAVAPTPSAEPKHDPAAVTRSLIRGTFPFSQAEPFAFLIKSLCPETGYLGEFRDWDRVYNAAPDVKAPKNSIRLRSHIVLAATNQTSQKHSQEPTFSLIYLGIPDRRVMAPCEKRPVTTVAIGKEADSLLGLLGCVFMYEYVRRGVRHITRQGYVVDLYLVEKLRKPGDVSQSVALSEGEEQYGVVEVISDNGATPEELTAFMQYFAPFVTLRSPPKRRV